MHFVIGGAFHGKKRWVVDQYCINPFNSIWFNCYESITSFRSFEFSKLMANTVVIEGLEQLIMNHDKSFGNLPNVFQAWLQEILEWEKLNRNRQVIIIGTDIGKGVVPVEKKQRLDRDEVGRCFQLLTQQATEVSLIWYGIQQKIKLQEEKQ